MENTSAPLLLVPFDVWNKNILSRYAPSFLKDLCGFFGACRQTRAIVGRVFRPILAATTLFRSVIEPMIWEDAGVETMRDFHVKLADFTALAVEAPDWFFVHMWLWSQWAAKEGDLARLELQGAEGRLRIVLKQVEDAENLLFDRDRQLATKNYGHGRAYSKRGHDDKEWTETRRDDAARKLAKLQPGKLGAEVNVRLANLRVREIRDEPRAWCREKGVLGRLRETTMLREEIMILRLEEFDATAQIALVERKRARIQQSIGEAKHKIAKLKGEFVE